VCLGGVVCWNERGVELVGVVVDGVAHMDVVVAEDVPSEFQRGDPGYHCCDSCL
jgi:hypothetical protein